MAAGRELKVFAAADLQPGNLPRAEAALGALCSDLRAAEGRLLSQYLEASPLCVELFAVWESLESSENGRIAALILEVLSAVLEGRFAHGARTVKTRSSVAGRIMGERLQALYRYMNSERDNLLRACLRVLTGISSQSMALASQLVRTFNFEHQGFLKLVGRRSQKEHKSGEHKDARHWFKSFALSFLRWKDPALTAAALGIKGFISPILSGLSQDSSADVIHFLQDIGDLIVANRQVPRNSKLFFFNAYALRHLCGLMLSEDEELVRHVQDFLIDLCTNTYLFRAQQHQLLLDMCFHLRPLQEPQQALILAVLGTHRMLQTQFCSKLTLSLQPQLSTQWLLNQRFLVKLLGMELGDAALAENCDQGDHEGDQGSAAAEGRSWIGDALMPRALQKTIVTQALMHTHILVMFSTLQLLCAVLSRTRRVLTACSDKRFLVLQGYVQQSMPAPDTLLNIWQKLIKQEDDAVDLSGFASQAEVDEAFLAKLIDVPAEGLKLHVVFREWCKVVQAYCEVLPRSMLDVKFDWSKLLAAVSAPILTCADLASLGPGMLERLVPSISCVDVAMRCGGRMQGMQLSKSQVSWVEAMLRICTATCLYPRRDKTTEADAMAAEALATSEAALCGCFRHVGLFAAEEDIEAAVWISQLRRRPVCISFFCNVMQTVTAKPGAIASQVSSLPVQADDKSRAGVGALQARPSLFLIAACKLLAQGDKQALSPPAVADAPERGAYIVRCAQFVRGGACQIGTFLLHMAPQMSMVARSLGVWCSNSESADESTRQKVEEHRQALLRRLDQKASLGHAFRNPEPRSADCAAAVARALKELVEQHLNMEDTGGKDAEELPLADLRLQISRLVPRASAYLHCGAYILLEGVHMCCLGRSQYQLACWYLLILIDLVPIISAAASPVLDHTLSHPVWLEVLQMASLKEDAHSSTFNLFIMLVFDFLWRLLDTCLSSNSGKDSIENSRYTTCESVLMRVLLLIPSGPGILQSFDGLVKRTGDDSNHPRLWADDPLHIASSNLVLVLLRVGLLEKFVSSELSTLRDETKFAVISSILMGHVLDGRTTYPFMELTVSKRAQLLHVLVQAVFNDESSRVEGILRKAFTMDQKSLLHFSMMATLKELWPKQHRKRLGLHSPLLTLLEYACRVNVALRRSLLRQLSWTSAEPRVVLQLAISLAPLERSLPFLEDDSLASVSPEALCPLPAVEQLRELVVLHAPLNLIKTLHRAAAGSATGGCVEARYAVLRLQELHGKPAALEQKLLAFVASCTASQASAEDSKAALQEARYICRTLQHLNAPSAKLLRELEGYALPLANGCAEAASILLGRLLTISGTESPRSSLAKLAAEIIENHTKDSVPEWLLRHAVLWSPHLDSSEVWYRQFVALVSKEYSASLTPIDRLRRQFLLAAATSGQSVKRDVPAQAWAFRHWGTNLSFWGESVAWSWVLESQRVRATTDRFWYSRPMFDPEPREPPVSSAEKLAAQRPASTRILSKSSNSEEQAYDIGYIAPFVAGQLRTHWAENGIDSVDSRRLMAPILSSIISGGVLELLLLACACSDDSIRACAYESLAVIMAFGSFWDDAASAKARPEDEGSKTRLPFKELPQFMRLLKSTRDALEPPTDEGGPPPALPTLIASFLSACVSVLLQPQHFLYMRIGLFFLGQSSLVLADVPLFYKLMLFGQAESDRARLWICRVIRRGLYEPEASKCIQDFEFIEHSNGHASGNRTARVALAHRYVVQWLLSFASSGELGNFAMWSEAVSCVEAAFADPANGLQASHRFSISEWISSQISRAWPGLGDRDHRFQALQSLTRLVSVLVHHRANSGSGNAAELLSIGGAMEGIVRTWVSVARAGSGVSQVADICLQLWLITHQLAKLIASSAAGLADKQCSSPVAAHAAQIGAILQQLLELSTINSASSAGDTPDLASIICRAFGHTAALNQSLAMLKVCPLSTGLQNLAIVCSGRLTDEEPGVSTGSTGAPSDHHNWHEGAQHEDGGATWHELSASILQVLGRMLAASRAAGHLAEPMRLGLASFAYAFAMLPYKPDTLWRVHVLICSLLLVLQPDACPDIELLNGLPSPTEALSPADSMHEQDEEATANWSLSVGKLLKQLLAHEDSGAMVDH